MTKNLLDLPDELLEIILSNLIDQSLNNDVKDFLSFTSTCRYLRKFVRDEKCWQNMVLRRDSSVKSLLPHLNCLSYCQQIYSTRTIPGGELLARISPFNNEYFCVIEKVILYPEKIRIYIDERGDNSLGPIQDPNASRIALTGTNYRTMIRCIHSEFSIQNPTSQYFGYLEFPLKLSADCLEKTLTFTYGQGGYLPATLFCIDQTSIEKYKLTHLFHSL